MDAFGKSDPELLPQFWTCFNKRLHGADVQMKTLILKQTVVDNDFIDAMAACMTNIENVKLVNLDMNKKQWARFALEMNKSEKKIQSLGQKFIASIAASSHP